ncbi:hypothetical protein R1flu_015374 [Riccia fluitans]|uniref:GTP cyclohydrolase 1 n=1 Tax=Riccia fluitans TaxID=41844 RepID=A0ABD1YJ01_9MARC
MPCPSFPVSIWEDEHEECGGCEAGHFKVPMESIVDRRTSSELQMAAAVKILLKEIGEDVEREGILKTPLRVAKAFQSFVSGYGLSPEAIIGGALFTEAGTDGGTGGGSGGMVVVRKIDSFALCDTCLLPFRLRSHVAYIPSGQRVVGLSKLPRVVSMLSRRLQNPQKLCNELVQALYDSFGSLGVGAAVESWHLEWPGVADRNGSPTGGGCVEDRLGFGWVPTSVYAARGKFESLQSSLWDEFLSIVEMDGIEIRRPSLGTINALPGKDKSCPFFSYSGSADCHDSVSALAQAIESLLRAEGEHVSREDLEMTTSRYVNWLLSATDGSSQQLADLIVNDTELSSLPVHVSGNGCRNHVRSAYGNDTQQDTSACVVSSHHSCSKGAVYAGTNGIANGHSNGVHNAWTTERVNGYSNGVSHGVSSGGVSAVQSIDEYNSNGVHHVIGNGFGNGHSNGVQYAGTAGCVNGFGNGVSHGVTSGGVCAVQSTDEHNRNGVHHVITNGCVNGYSNGISHGSAGAVNGFRGSGDVCNGNHGGQNGVANGYSNGTAHAVPNNIVSGYSKDIRQNMANGVHSLPYGGIRLGKPLLSGLDDRSGSPFILELDLPLSSLCEHHLLPFSGVAHVGYLGGTVGLERSLVLKIVRMFSRRPQVQERLTRQIAEAIAPLADVPWIMVVVEANHMCIISRGAEKLGSTTATVATAGQLANDGAMRAAFLKKISRKGQQRTIS